MRKTGTEDKPAATLAPTCARAPSARTSFLTPNHGESRSITLDKRGGPPRWSLCRVASINYPPATPGLRFFADFCGQFFSRFECFLLHTRPPVLRSLGEGGSTLSRLRSSVFGVLRWRLGVGCWMLDVGCWLFSFPSLVALPSIIIDFPAFFVMTTRPKEHRAELDPRESSVVIGEPQ